MKPNERLNRRRRFPAVVAALLLPVGPAAAVAPPPTPAGQQLAWLLEELNSSPPPSVADLKQHFSPGFLKAVPPPTLLGALVSVRSGRPLRLTAVFARVSPLQSEVLIESRRDATFRVTLSVSGASSHLIEGLLFEPVAAQLTNWGQVDAALRRLGDHPALYAGFAGGHSIHTLDSTRPGAIGSAFKLYVLGALAQAVSDGNAEWNDTLAIRDAWKSLPSGAMRDEPAGTRFSLRHYAEQMISVSDNTAADHLIRFLGRPAVESGLIALGNRSVATNEPFLTTRELFALKLAAPVSLRDAFAQAGPTRRRQLLSRVDHLSPTPAEARGWTAPRAIAQIEWFASPADLARAINALVGEARRPHLQPLRSILAINPGIKLDRTLWPYIGFKGGSEPGVLSLTWYLQRGDGRTFVVSIVVNDSSHDIDEVAAISIAEAAIGLLSHT